MVYFDPSPMGHLIQHMHNPEVGVVWLSQAKTQKRDIVGISKTTIPTNAKHLDNVSNMIICYQANIMMSQ